MWLLPEDVADVSESLFEELLADLKEAVGEACMGAALPLSGLAALDHAPS
jgi:hypothetical protein